MNGVFLAGTDTGVGKTAVGCALLHLARRLGLRPLPFKPVETGCDPNATDAVRLRAAAATDLTLVEVCPFQFNPPVAPALAARQAGVLLTLATLTAPLSVLSSQGDFLLVEAAGGLLTPYAPGVTGADLAAAVALPILLCARNALGTINHTALALAELRRRALPLAGLVLVEVTPDATPDRPHNAAMIEQLTGERPLATLPFIPGADPEAIADALAAQVEPAALFARFTPRDR